MDGSPTQVKFVILEVLKGRLPSSTIEFNGVLTDRDDPNDRPVPYDSVRPGGHGACVALNYRTGAEYLLLLRRGEDPAWAHPNALTPYWVPLGPTNEQLFDGACDPLVRLGQSRTAAAIARPIGRLSRRTAGLSRGAVSAS
jgi:hypothetical protein